MVQALKSAANKSRSRYDQGVISRIVMKYYDTLARAFLLGEDDLMELYENTYNEPDTSTKERIFQEYNIAISKLKRNPKIC
jgi:hypothetical protein